MAIMTEQGLNLLQFAATCVTQFGAGLSRIVRGTFDRMSSVGYQAAPLV
jgi:hypothetical protein